MSAPRLQGTLYSNKPPLLLITLALFRVHFGALSERFGLIVSDAALQMFYTDPPLCSLRTSVAVLCRIFKDGDKNMTQSPDLCSLIAGSSGRGLSLGASLAG